MIHAHGKRSDGGLIDGMYHIHTSAIPYLQDLIRSVAENGMTSVGANVSARRTESTSTSDKQKSGDLRRNSIVGGKLNEFDLI